MTWPITLSSLIGCSFILMKEPAILKVRKILYVIPRAYGLKASNAALPISTFTGAIPVTEARGIAHRITFAVDHM
jgi:hypothetical protein